jgi:hypothetical protein
VIDPETNIHKIIESLNHENKILKECNKILSDLLWEILEIVKNMEDKPEKLKEWRIRCLKKMGLM